MLELQKRSTDRVVVVIPISEHQDTIGPFGRSVADAALVLSIIAGRDPADNFTLAQPPVVPDFSKALNKTSLQGARIGVPRAVFLNDSITGNDPFVNEVFEQAIETLKSLGATIIDPADLPSVADLSVDDGLAGVLGNETLVLDVDFKNQVNAWFKSLLDAPSGVRSLAGLIHFNDANAALEEPANFTDQSGCVFTPSQNL